MAAKKQDGRKFGFTMAIAIGVIALILLYRHRVAGASVAGCVAVFFLFFALVAPRLLEPVEKVWMAFAHVLGEINTRIIMGFIYLVVFVPLGLLFRVLGRDEMHRRPALLAKTNWEAYRKRQLDKRHYENMF